MKGSDYAVSVGNIYLVIRICDLCFQNLIPSWNFLKAVTFTFSLKYLCFKETSLCKPEINENWRHGPTLSYSVLQLQRSLYVWDISISNSTFSLNWILHLLLTNWLLLLAYTILIYSTIIHNTPSSAKDSNLGVIPDSSQTFIPHQISHHALEIKPWESSWI